MAEEFHEAGFSNEPTLAESLARRDQQRKLRQVPYIRDTVLQIREILGVRPGGNFIEFACGDGHNALEMARIVGPDGRVLALDHDKFAIADATKIATKEQLNVQFRHADITKKLAEAEKGKFDGVMVDRALAHIPGFAKVVANMSDVLKRGGIVVAHDALWLPTSKYPGLEIDSDEAEINRIIVSNYAGDHGAPRIGKEIEQVFENNGLINIKRRLGVMEINNFQTARELAGIDTVVNTLTQPGDDGQPILSRDQADRWMSEQAKRAQEGKFRFALPFILTQGTKA